VETGPHWHVAEHRCAIDGRHAVDYESKTRVHATVGETVSITNK